MQLSAGKKAVVVGLGKSGLAAVKYLHRQGCAVAVSEYRDLDRLSGDELSVLDRYADGVEAGGHSEKFVSDADLILVSPGVPANLPVLLKARSMGVPVLGELGLAADKIRVPVIAVTGSNGKTTVTSLIGHLLRSAGRKVFVGGNIGTPVLEYLLDPADIQVVVLEVSSFQLESAGDFRPDIGLLLNLSPDHLDWHGSMQAYSGAKRKLFAHQVSSDVAIIGADDPLLAEEPLQTAGSVYSFGTGPDCRARLAGRTVLVKPGFDNRVREEVFDLAASPLTSTVNRYNAAAAILAARSFGCSREGIRAGLADYQPPEHRMTLLGEINGIRFVNDSKATNVGAVLAGLAGFKKDVVLIAGGRDKGSDFSVLRSAIRQHVKHLVLIGEAGPDLARALGGIVSSEEAQSMQDAVARAFAAAEREDTVLLAPACASFDMFANYSQRGRVFTRCVQDLRSSVKEKLS